MQAPFELTEGQARLEKIIEDFPTSSPYWNEAQNRFHFVDRLLTECLGWERPSIEVEASDGLGGKADYVLGQPAKAVLEAKREAQIFNTLPTGEPTLVRKLQPLLRASKPFEDAVRQVITYCSLKGAQIAVICNGPQLAVFQALIPGVSPLDGECFLFNGFDTYIQYFPQLWALLSPEGVTENRAYRTLALRRNPRIPRKTSEQIPDPYKYRYRNNFQENLRALSSLLLEEIEDNPSLKSSFYRKCYVPIEANNRHLLLSKQIISARYRRVSGDGVLPSALDEAAVIDRGGEINFTDATLVGGVGSRPIVVIGDVGVGKKSFFENLYENMEISEKVKTYFIHVNLGLKANLSSDIKSYILSQIPLVLNDNYDIDIESADFVKAIYHAQLEDFDKGIKGELKNIDNQEYQRERIAFLSDKVSQRDSHLLASLGHLAKGRNKQIILVMDNADQRSFSVQQETFLIAQELAATRNILVFVALRPSTFYQSKMSGALSGYQHKIFTISPPPADQVLEKRLTFAVQVAEGKVHPAALEGIILQMDNVVCFLNATLRSIRNSEPIKQFLNNITGGNTRQVVELITGFCGSPNVDSYKIVRIEDQKGNYMVPLHEFTKHALLGDYAYFNNQSSLVACNIFDVSAADPREHFLASLVVAYLSSNLGVRDNDGFVRGDSVMTEMRRHGFIEDQCQLALRRLAAKRLIETPHSHYRELPVSEDSSPEQFYYRATSVGVYHIRFWSGSFEFLDATATDTPIFEDECRDEVSNLSASFNISDRFRRANCFKQYLESQWFLANIGAHYYDFSTLMEMQSVTFESVRKFVERRKTDL